ncbi:MAG: flagellin [Burkholderiaceae bacterium]
MSVINTNVKALSAQASMSSVNKSMETAMERLSTGIRINSAKDDAAGLAIALKMTADIRGTAVAIRNANDAISLSQTAEGGLGQINDILQRMRELSVQSSNATASLDNRQASQLEISQLKQEIDTIANRTNFNGIKLLDGTAAKLNIQTGVNAGDMMTMNISAARTQDIGIGGRASLSATGHFFGTAGSLDKQINAGDLLINGVQIAASTADNDGLSSGDKSSSAIAKVAAINASSAQTGVLATVGKTTVSGTIMTNAASTSGTVTINGVTTDTISVTADAGVSRTNVVNAINLISAQTGVKAVDTGDLKKGVLLVADDGRNITFSMTTIVAANTGLGTVGVYSGAYQLTSTTGSPIVLSSSASGKIANAGVVAGTYQANVSTVTSTARALTASATAPSASTTGLLEAGTMRINGIAIDAAVTASDTASYVSTTSTKAASGIAIAAAINAKTSLTGVTASAQPTTIVGDTFTASSIAKDISINGVKVDLSAAQSSTRGGIATEINKVTGQTGVVATDNGRGLTLTAADGRNITLIGNSGASGATTAADFGLSIGGVLQMTVVATTAGVAFTAGNAVTTYSAITLSSDTSFSIEGGSDGNQSFEKLGFKTGVVGGNNNGIKVSTIDVSTQGGAQLAITALDAAMKSVSMNQAQLGAYQNRLESAINNLTEGSTNMNASRSRVLDTDYAKESTNLAKAQIITQAATAMLAQANQSAQSVLALLK